MTGDEKTTETLLRSTLGMMVPLLIEEYRSRPFDELQRIAAESSQIIAEKGDLILYKSKVKGETARAVNALARGIAVLAFMPGGVTAFGDHWEATPTAAPAEPA